VPAPPLTDNQIESFRGDGYLVSDTAQREIADGEIDLMASVSNRPSSL
jgi:hypothetical protein